MATNFVQPGNFLSLPLAPGVTSGSPVLVGSIFGVATTDAPSGGGPTEVAVGGVWDLPKAAGAAINQGAPVYFDTAAKVITAVSTGHWFCGVAAETAASAATVVRVRLGLVPAAASA